MARYERIVQLDVRAAVAANNLAWLYTERGGNLDVALQLARTAKQLLPDAPEVNDTLGWVYYKKGMTSLAIPPLVESVQKDPKIRCITTTSEWRTSRRATRRGPGARWSRR